MAVPGPAEALLAAASCPVCLELFRDPVSLRCGHNFCRGCVERCGPGAAGPLRCPQCRDAAPELGLRPSRELGHIAGIARELLPALLPPGPPPGSECRRHRQPLRLFCREERALLCPECARERRHRQHRELPAEEAAREYRERIQRRLQSLREEREKFRASRSAGGRSPHLVGGASGGGAGPGSLPLPGAVLGPNRADLGHAGFYQRGSAGAAPGR